MESGEKLTTTGVNRLHGVWKAPASLCFRLSTIGVQTGRTRAYPKSLSITTELIPRPSTACAQFVLRRNRTGVKLTIESILDLIDMFTSQLIESHGSFNLLDGMDGGGVIFSSKFAGDLGKAEV